MPVVLNKRRKNDPRLKTGVYVGRPSKYGNPIHLDNEGERDRVVDDHDKWLDGDANLVFMYGQPPSLAEIIADLRGRDLICWCAPKRCHADNLLRRANR